MARDRSTTRRSAPVYRARPWVILALLIVAGFGAYFHFVSSAPLPIDDAWRAFVRLEPGSFGFAVALFLAEVGSTVGVAACAAISGALLFTIRERRAAWAVLVACALGVAMSQFAKFLVERPRPMGALYEAAGSSFPSGHSMGAAALTVSLVFAIATLSRRPDTWITRSMVRWAALGAGVWIVAMMWSRTALGVHWLSDTLAGATVGVSAAIIAQWVCGQPRTVVRGAA